MTLSSGTPEAWCSPSIFCVMTADTMPRSTSAATARWPLLGRAPVIVLSVSILRRQVSRRISSEEMKSSNMIGL